MSTPKLLSVIIPVFEERNTVGEVIRRVRSVELPNGMDREIIVVDDGSRDGTDKVLRALEDSTVRVVTHASNSGQGAAVRTGLDYARGEIILIQDADLEYNPSDIPRVVQPIIDGRADVVYGSRFHPARSVMPLTNLLMDRALSIATCFLYNTSLTDIETGYRAFSSRVLAAVKIDSDRFEFGPELTAKLFRLHARFFEVPVSYVSRKEGRKFGTKDRISAFFTLLKYRVRPLPTITNAKLGGRVIDLRQSTSEAKSAQR